MVIFPCHEIFPRVIQADGRRPDGTCARQVQDRRNELEESFPTVPCEHRGVELKLQSPNDGEPACAIRRRLAPLPVIQLDSAAHVHGREAATAHPACPGGRYRPCVIAPACSVDVCSWSALLVAQVARTTCIVSRRREQCCGAEIDVIVVYRRCAASVRSCHALFRP